MPYRLNRDPMHRLDLLGLLGLLIPEDLRGPSVLPHLGLLRDRSVRPPLIARWDLRDLWDLRARSGRRGPERLAHPQCLAAPGGPWGCFAPSFAALTPPRR